MGSAILGAESVWRAQLCDRFGGFFSIIAQAGLKEIIVRDLVTEPESSDEILGTGFALKLLSGIAAFLLALAAGLTTGTHNPQMPWLVGIIAAGTIFQAAEIVEFWFQSQVRSNYAVYAKNLAYLIANATKILLIVYKAPLIAFAIVTVAELLLAAVGLAVFYRIAGHSFRVWRASYPLALKFLSQSWPNILAGVSITIYMRIDQLMLGNMVGDAAVGTYAVGVRIAEIWYFIPVSIVASVTPSIIQAKQEGEAVYYARIQKVLNLLAMVFYAIGIATTFLAAPLINFLYGAKYADASSILAIYVWSGLFVSLGLVRSAWVTTEGLFRFGSLTTFIGAAVNVLLNLVLIPRYGAAGAALATLISYGFSDYLILSLYPRSQKLCWGMTRALSLDFIVSKLRVLMQK
ncbi:MAG: flippase [Chamaesiphon sp. CSU_1_12]|nr:flippase [Chamaesiphon sp. CSU_1_12]